MSPAFVNKPHPLAMADRAARQRAAKAQVMERTAELQKAETALEAERRRFHDVLDALPVYVILLTPDYHVPFANRFFRERFGESHGKRCFEYLFGRTEPCEVCDTYKVLKTHAPHEWEWTGPDGRQYQIFDFPFADTDGSPLILEMGIDVTERKQTAAELEMYRHRLEELVNQRTRQLKAVNLRLQAEISERRRVGQEMTRLASFPERNPNPVVEADLAGRVHYLNPAARRWLPGLERKGSAHPWLADWPAVARSIRRSPSRSMVREISCGRNVYHQSLYYVKEAGRIRIYGMDITARKESERAVRRANERLELAQRASGAGMWDWDVPAKRLEWSPRMFELFGLDPRKTAASFKAWEVILHPEDRKLAAARIAQALRKRSSLKSEYRIVKPNGQVRWIRALGRGRYDNRGRPVRMIGLCIDITEVKEREKREKEGEVSAIAARTAMDTIGAMPIGMAVIRMGGRVASVNPAFEGMTGYRADEMLGQAARDAIGKIVAADDRTRFFDLLKDARRGKPAASLAVSLRTKAGAAVPVIIDLAFIRYPMGTPSSIVMTFKDITERRRVEDRLRHSRAMLEEAQRMARIGNWEWNIATGGLTWSDEIYRIFGRTSQSFVATYDTFLNSVHPEDRERVRAAVNISLRHRQPYDIDHRIVLPDGAERVVHEHGEVFQDNAGRAVRMAGTVQDITDQKRAERRSQMITTLLALFARKATRHEYLDAVTRVFHQESGCRCVGIRIVDEQGRIPYALSSGFPRGLLENENALVIGRDACLCGRIMAGTPEPRDRACLTPAGSFRCDNLPAFFKRLSPRERKRYRGQCAKYGFKSMAVVPIRYHDRLYGAIHLADEREGRISSEQIGFIESIMAPMIGEAIHWFAMDESLRQAGAYNRSLIEVSLDPLVTIDAAGKITDVNAATEKITGRSRTELVGTDFADYFTDFEKAQSGYRQAFRDGWVQDYALEIRRRDGRVTPVLYNASVYRNEQGKVIGVFAAARDITERKRAEADLAAYQHELRSLSSRLLLAEERERRQLAVALHDTVGQTQALAQIKLEALGEMITDRNARQAWAEVRRMFVDAVQQTRTLSFELSPPILYELGLDPALEWLGEMFQQRHGFQFHFESEGDKAAVADSMRVLMFQSARELLTNAVKHARATHVHLSSRLDDGTLVVSVKDDGQGFDLQDQESLINKSSLGLFSLRERMRNIGGQFTIETRPGQGVLAVLEAPVAAANGARERSGNKETSR